MYEKILKGTSEGASKAWANRGSNSLPDVNHKVVSHGKGTFGTEGTHTKTLPNGKEIVESVGSTGGPFNSMEEAQAHIESMKPSPANARQTVFNALSLSSKYGLSGVPGEHGTFRGKYDANTVSAFHKELRGQGWKLDNSMVDRHSDPQYMNFTHNDTGMSIVSDAIRTKDGWLHEISTAGKLRKEEIMYAKIMKAGTSEGAKKAWISRHGGGGKASPKSSKGKAKTPDEMMGEAMKKPMKIKSYGGVSQAVDNAAEGRMKSSPNQAHRDAYWKAMGSKNEASALRDSIGHLKKRGFLPSSDAKEMLAQIGTKNQYDLAKILFEFKTSKAKKSDIVMKQSSLEAVTGVNSL